MRRLAAVFASKRSDRSDAASSSATTEQSEATTKPFPSRRFFRSISRKNRPVDPIVNRLNSSELHPPSSSSSSSGAPTTPDDDRGSLLRAPASKAWLPLPHPVDSRLGSFHHLDSVPHDSTRLSIPPQLASPSTLDTDDDLSDDDESSVAHDIPNPTSSPSERSTPLAAPAYLLVFTSSNLRPPYAPPPLLHVQYGPIFPRSSNSCHTLSYADSLESTMHRKKIQRRLQRCDLTPAEARSIASFSGRRSAIKDRPSLHLDDNAVRQVQSHSPGLRKWADRLCFEDRTLVLVPEIVPVGPGGNGEPTWTRIQPATAYGVAALEYSVTLELLAGFYEDNLPHEPEGQGALPEVSALGYFRLDTQLSLDLNPPLPQSPSTSSPTSSLNPPSSASMSSTPSATTTATGSKPVLSSVISQSRGQTYRASPSPLRMEAVPVSPPMPSTAVVSPVASAVPATVASPSPPIVASPPPSASSVPTPLKSALKQGVRFAEVEKADQIPLGYVKRIEQQRKEKARFLEAERQRRKHDEERRKHDEEKRKWEQERAQWEQERRAMEEDRKKRLYAEEVAASRRRRESQRFGALGAMTGDGLATGQWDRGERSRPDRDRSSSASYPRAAYDPAGLPHMPVRQNSDSSLVLAKASRQGSGSGSGSGSPEDSRPNSVYGSGSVTGGSRPPSMHSGTPTPSASQQDVRNNRERRMSSRASMVSESGGSWRRSDMVPVPALPSAWNMGMGMNMNMPMMNMPMGMPMQMPMYGMGMDMPLLPPSPPFMQQHGYRSPGTGNVNGSSGQPSAPQRSQSSSPTLGRHNHAAADSTERVNRMAQARGTSRSGSPRAPSLPRSESANTTPTTLHNRTRHQRVGSGGTVPPPSQRPSMGPRSRTEDRRGSSAKSSSSPVGSHGSGSHRPGPPYTSSIPPHPPPAFSQARSSWALPQTGFENVSKPSSGRRQTMIS